MTPEPPPSKSPKTSSSPPLSDELVPPFLDLLQTLRSICGGDLEKNIILLAIAERMIAHPDFRALTSEQRVEGRTPPFPTRGVNIRSIADSSGIPRETVRRKVADLLRLGWIAQGSDGLRFSPEGYRALTPAREKLEELARQFHRILVNREAADGE